MIAIDDPLKRTFYEVECIRGNWSIVNSRGRSAASTTSALASMDSEKLVELAQAEADQFDLSAKEWVQAGATIKKNLEVLGYGE